MKVLAFAAVLFWSMAVSAKPADLYLFYNSASENLGEINIAPAEVAKVFDDVFGPASDELPDKVRYEDFFVAKFPDGRYVFILNASFNCAQLGCATAVYQRDADGDLMSADSIFPVKCKDYASDKLLCVRGGYQPAKPKAEKKRGPVHYPAPSVE